MSFVVRARSFDSLDGYCRYAAGVQSPLKMIPFHARMWRMVEPRERTFMGNLLAEFEGPVLACTKALLKLVRSLNGARRRILRRR